MPPPPSRNAAYAGGGADRGATSSGTRSKDSGEKPPGTFFLGRYRVVDEIGVGGMASVHLARMDGPGGFQKWVAIKRIHPHLVEDDQFVDMFLDEARIAAGINHANVAQVFDLGKDDNTYWIAMEYLHGEPLREVMRRAEERHMRISPELAAKICSDAAEGLHAAHELRGKNGQLLGLVHRDVTPHNLFLTYDGYTKVVDFGIAKVADRLSSTRAGTLKGKLAYMSPEQVRGAEVDRTTDIFALGVVLWELTTNQRLFRMDTDLDTLEKVQACIVPPPSTIVPDYPVELESVVMKALAKRKQDRFANARDFSRALLGFLMRRGSFVGSEEVSQFVKTVFADRIQKREAHLAWAAEVTSTVNVDQLRGGGGGGGGGGPSLSGEEADSDRDDSGSKRGRGVPISGGHAPASSARLPLGPPPPSVQPQSEAQMASTSLMDDDEDVPTTVAMREQMASVALRMVTPDKGQPRPAAGGRPMPAAGGPAYAQHAPPPPPQPPPRGPSQAYAQGPQSQAPRTQAFPQIPQGYAPQQNERTAAIPSPLSADDLGATIALPNPMDELPRPPPPPGPPKPYGQYGGPQPGYNNGQGQHGGYGPPPQAYSAYSAPQAGPQQPIGFGPPPFSSPPQGQGHGGYGAPQMQQGFNAPPMGLPPMNGPPNNSHQSQIETALSLPRPDPAALWLAQQEKQRGQRKNTGVVVAVVVLAIVCLVGVALMLYFKLRAPPAVATSDAAATSSAAVAQASAPAPEPSAPASAAGALAPAAPSSSAVASPSASATAAPAPAVQAPSMPQSPSPSLSPLAANKDEPGYLTVVCNPYCDDVSDQGKSLGPSPIVHLSVKPGQHRVTLKKGTQTKIISVIVISGQVTAQRVSMK